MGLVWACGVVWPGYFTAAFHSSAWGTSDGKRFAFVKRWVHFFSKERIKLNSTINRVPHTHTAPLPPSLLTFAVQVTAHSVGIVMLLLTENKKFIR